MGECQANLGLDLNLVDPLQLVFDRVLGRDDFGTFVLDGSGERIDFLLNFEARLVSTDPNLVIDDGKDTIFGDGGNPFSETWDDIKDNYNGGYDFYQETIGDIGRGLIHGVEDIVGGIGQMIDTLVIDNLGSLGDFLGLFDYERRYNLVDHLFSLVLPDQQKMSSRKDACIFQRVQARFG